MLAKQSARGAHRLRLKGVLTASAFAARKLAKRKKTNVPAIIVAIGWA
jgi:hypothetical protein